MLNLIKAGLIYFAFVFAIGFFLGTIRILWLVPSLGIRNAELLEMPLMLVAIMMAGNWINLHLHHQNQSWSKIAVGLCALILLLGAEILTGMSLQGLSFLEVFTKHDPVSGTVYYLMLGVFALMPWLLWKYGNYDHE
jgi:hypothetical protein